MLHISKRKAAWMLQNGIIPCEIRNTPTHKYSVKKEDVLAYMAKRDREKHKEIPVGIFNAKKTNNPRRTESQGSDCGGYFDDTNYKLRGKDRARFKEMLEDLLSAVPTRSPWTMSPSSQAITEKQSFGTCRENTYTP